MSFPKRLSPKQPYEEYFVRLGFSRDLGAETIGSVTVSVSPENTTEDVTSVLIDADKTSTSGTDVYVWLRGGVDGVTYKGTLRVVGDQGSKYEREFLMEVSNT